MKKNIIALLLLASAISFSGCGTNRVDYYSNYQVERLLVDSVIVMADLELSYDRIGQITEKEKNLYLGLIDSMSAYTSSSLADKGYNITSVEKSIINRIVKSGLQIKGIASKAYREVPATLKRSRRRFSREEILNSVTSYFVLDSIVQDTAVMNMFPNYLNPPDTSIVVAEQEKINLLALVSVLGTQKLSDEQKIGLAAATVVTGLVFPTAVLYQSGGATISVSTAPPLFLLPFSNYIIRLWLIDRGTGKVLWFNHRIEPGFPENFKEMKYGLQSILDNIPRHGKNKKGND